MPLKKLSEHVYYVQGKAGIATDNEGFISNAAAIITDEGIIIFDALGSPSLAKKFIHQIRTISRAPIKKLIISHYHADHFYGAQVFREQGAEIIAPIGAKKYLARDGALIRLNERRKSLSPWVNKQTKLTSADRYLSKDTTISIGGIDINVISFGSAHSDGDLSLFVVQDQILLTGDLLFTGRIPFVGGNELKSWTQKIIELSHLPSKLTLPGHGAAFQDYNKGSLLTRSYLNLLLKVMSEGVDELMSFDEIYQQTDWSNFSSLPAFKNGNRLNAYRVFLDAERRALNQP